MNQKNEKGITLIALVITIIVLLILAGVTINMVLGDEGIIQNAQTAKEQHTNATHNEIIKKAMLTHETRILAKEEPPYELSLQEAIQEELDNAYGEEKYEIIKFKIHNTEYLAEKGMSWKEWVDSAYNTGLFGIVEEWVCVDKEEAKESVENQYGNVAYLVKGAGDYADPVKPNDILDETINYSSRIDTLM